MSPEDILASIPAEMREWSTALPQLAAELPQDLDERVSVIKGSMRRSRTNSRDYLRRKSQESDEEPPLPPRAAEPGS